MTRMSFLLTSSSGVDTGSSSTSQLSSGSLSKIGGIISIIYVRLTAKHEKKIRKEIKRNI